LSSGLSVSSKMSGLDIVTAQEGGYYWHPSDGAIAVGPTDVVQCVNVACEIWDKATGQSLGSFNPPALFGTPDFYVGDPMIFYDTLSGHFFLSTADFSVFVGGPSNNYWVAVSATSDPTGTWYIYNFLACSFCGGTTANGLIGDQPRIGASNQFFTESSNIFNATAAGEPFLGSVVQVWNKTAMGLGLGLSGWEFDLGPTKASVQPAISLSPTSSQYLVTGKNWASGLPTSTLIEYTIGGTIASPTIGSKSIALPHPMSVPPNADQPSGPATLATDDDRITSVMYNKGNIWFTYGDACTPSGDVSVRSCSGVAEIMAKPLTVLQQFDIGIAGKGTFYPGLGWGSKGIVVVFGYSSPTDYPGLMVTGQANGDPVNTYRAPITIALGFSSDASGRWGDYFGAAVDPASPSHVWVEGTYSGSGPTLGGANWATEIAQATV
jgi:hypothetical protein